MRHALWSGGNGARFPIEVPLESRSGRRPGTAVVRAALRGDGVVRARRPGRGVAQWRGSRRDRRGHASSARTPPEALSRSSEPADGGASTGRPARRLAGAGPDVAPTGGRQPAGTGTHPMPGPLDRDRHPAEGRALVDGEREEYVVAWTTAG